MAARKDGEISLVIANVGEHSVPLELDICGKIKSCILTAKPQNESITALPNELPRESILSVFAEI